jgi:hypothetical protein
VTAVAGEAELYRRYKALALAAGAALVLGEPTGELEREVAGLVRDAQGGACAEPAARLASLLAGGAADDDLDAVRASHRSLRRRIWTTHTCEYVPCCAGAHHHEETA